MSGADGEQREVAGLWRDVRTKITKKGESRGVVEADRVRLSNKWDR